MGKINVFTLMGIVILMAVSCAEMSTEEKQWLNTPVTKRSDTLPAGIFRLQFFSYYYKDQGDSWGYPPVPIYFSWGLKNGGSLNLLMILPSVQFSLFENEKNHLSVKAGFIVLATDDEGGPGINLIYRRVIGSANEVKFEVGHTFYGFGEDSQTTDASLIFNNQFHRDFSLGIGVFGKHYELDEEEYGDVWFEPFFEDVQDDSYGAQSDMTYKLSDESDIVTRYRYYRSSDNGIGHYVKLLINVYW